MNIADEKEEALIEKQRGVVTFDRFTMLRRQIREREAKHGHDLDTLVPILAESSADLRAACEDGMKVAAEWFQDCNSGRWTRFFLKPNKAKIEKQHENLVGALSALRRTLVEFREKERVKLIKPFERFFDQETGRLLEQDGIIEHPRRTELFAAGFLPFQLPIDTNIINEHTDLCTSVSSSQIPSMPLQTD